MKTPKPLPSGYVFETIEQMNAHIQQLLGKELHPNMWDKGAIPFVHIRQICAAPKNAEFDRDIDDLPKNNYVSRRRIQRMVDDFTARHPGVPFEVYVDLSINVFDSFEAKIKGWGHDHGDSYVVLTVYDSDRSLSC